jgi:uncharacterized DUF497 family protein
MPSVRIEWDEAKRRTNLRKHGLDFADAESVFHGYTVTVEDLRKDYGEPRFLSFGLLQDRAVAIAHTERQDTIRIISMRKASKHEERNYRFRI